jgi:hypothetical protein
MAQDNIVQTTPVVTIGMGTTSYNGKLAEQIIGLSWCLTLPTGIRMNKLNQITNLQLMTSTSKSPIGWKQGVPCSVFERPRGLFAM